MNATLRAQTVAAAQPTVIRYELRYPAQAAFAATRPGSIVRRTDA